MPSCTRLGLKGFKAKQIQSCKLMFFLTVPSPSEKKYRREM